jgi:beta-glucanase (GH16 family)
MGGDGWGNDQLEHNTDRTDNARLDGEGHLQIVARREAFEGNDYTSARLTTNGTFTQGYGRFEARVRLPKGQGLWPAFWMLGDDFGDVGWPGCGEIDILEMRGEDPGAVLGTLHGPGYSGGSAVGDTYVLGDDAFAEDFHTFRVDVDEGLITWWVDDVVYQRRTAADLPDGTAWVFDHPTFLILNLAVGGHFVQPPTDATPFPATMLVDHVRVYERAAIP